MSTAPRRRRPAAEGLILPPDAKVLGINLAGLAEAPPDRPSEKVQRRGVPNKTEAWFARSYLEPMKFSGVIGGYAFESIRLLIADAEGTARCYYTPDFLSWGGKDGRLRAYELKGHWREAARLRIKVAAERHPWLQFIAVQRVRKNWDFEFIG